MRTKYLAAAAVLATSSAGVTALEAPPASADTVLTFACNTNNVGTICLSVNLDGSGNRYLKTAFTSNSTFNGGMDASYNGFISTVYLGQLTAHTTEYSYPWTIPSTSGVTVCGSVWKNQDTNANQLDFVCLTTP
jgi:hypothetical protein